MYSVSINKPLNYLQIYRDVDFFMYRTEPQAEEGRLYTILNIQSTASAEEVRSAYKKAAKLTHPDIHSVNSGEFEEVNKAYTILGNKTNRILYNIFGDGILPILQDQRYTGYIERIFSKRAIAMGGVFLVLLLLSTVFMPYFILLVSKEVLPYYTFTIIPHCLLYGVSVSIAVYIESRKMNPVVFHYLIYGGIISLLAISVCLYIDRIIGLVFLAGILALCEICHLGSEVVHSLQYIDLYTVDFVYKRIVRKVFAIRYITGCAIRIALTVSFMHDISPFIRAGIFSLYWVVLTVTLSIGIIEGVLLSFGSFMFGTLLALSYRNMLGLTGYAIILLVAVGGVMGAGRIVYILRKMFYQAYWKETSAARLTDKREKPHRK